MRRAILALWLLAAAPAQADTLGLLYCTHPDASFTVRRPRGPARTLLARSPAEWQATWKAVGGKAPAPALDFGAVMVVGVVNGPKDNRVVYRVQLDDARRPTALEVHVGLGDAPCGSGHTPPRARAHLVAVARSALPVHFIEDGMIDGHGYTDANQGVDSFDLGTLPAATRAAGTDKAPYREDAEAAAMATLTAAERSALAKGPLARPLPRLPHGWIALDAHLAGGVWTIRYNDLGFTVTAATAAVARVK